MAAPTKVGELKDHPGMPKEVPNIESGDVIKGTLHRGFSEFGPMDSRHCSIGWAHVIFSEHGASEPNAFSELFIKGLACSILKDSKARARTSDMHLAVIDERAKNGPDGMTLTEAQSVVINHNDDGRTTKQNIADLLNGGLEALGYNTSSSTLLKSNR